MSQKPAPRYVITAILNLDLAYFKVTKPFLNCLKFPLKGSKYRSIAGINNLVTWVWIKIFYTWQASVYQSLKGSKNYPGSIAAYYRKMIMCYKTWNHRHRILKRHLLMTPYLVQPCDILILHNLGSYLCVVTKLTLDRPTSQPRSLLWQTKYNTQQIFSSHQLF